MTKYTRPLRSVLYIPGSNLRALDKARNLSADAIIFDLEDAVAPGAKLAARETLSGELKKGGYGIRAKIVRINGLDTEWCSDDARAVAGMDCDAVLLPKVDSSGDIDAICAMLPDIPIWAMMETPLGVINALEIAEHRRVQGFVLGTNDLAKELGSRFRTDRLPLLHALQKSLMAARAAEIVSIDGVYNAFKDDAGLLQECEQGRDMGFDGKTLIHPAQIDIANSVFAPSDEEIDLARRQISAFEEAKAQGKGVAVVDGQIVENLHIESARATLAKLDTINASRSD